MRRLIRWLAILIVASGMAATASYVGARAAAGKFLGAHPPLTGRQVAFAFRGVAELSGTPRAWVFSYTRSALPAVRRAVIYISPTGRIIETRPRNLDLILEAWERARQP